MSNITGDDGSFSSGHSGEEVHQKKAKSGFHGSTAAAGSTSSSTENNSNDPFQPPLLVTAKKKRNLPGTPDPTAEVVALSPTTLMATNRFLCEVCNKGFQREQNLQLHRRGHNLPWKLKQRTSTEIRKKVFICPETSCVHHNPARALGDLTGIKKHFSRKHGEKKWKCDKCSKKYAVQSDWKAHQKTCGTRDYKCDCGTIFSRRDSFITHRAFCDALTEENNRVNQTKLLNTNLGSNSQTQFQNDRLSWMSPSEFDYYDLKGTLKSIPEDLTPTPFNPMNISAASGGMFSTSSGTLFGGPKSISSPSSSLQLSSNSSSCFNGDQVSGLCHMSATAFLQKAAQMGATASNSNNAPMMQKSFGSSYGSNMAGTNGGGLINNHLFDTTNGSSPMNEMGLLHGLFGHDDDDHHQDIHDDSSGSSNPAHSKPVMERTPLGRSRFGNNDNGSATTTLDFLGIGNSLQINLHEQQQQHVREMEAISQQIMQVMNPFQQQLSHGESSLEKPM